MNTQMGSLRDSTYLSVVVDTITTKLFIYSYAVNWHALTHPMTNRGLNKFLKTAGMDI